MMHSRFKRGQISVQKEQSLTRLAARTAAESMAGELATIRTSGASFAHGCLSLCVDDGGLSVPGNVAETTGVSCSAEPLLVEACSNTTGGGITDPLQQHSQPINPTQESV
jgi:hypothetical protein